MAFSQSLNPNVFEKHNRVLFLPSSWNRLMTLIKYQAPNAGFAVMEGEFGSGKSSFGQIFEKKLVLDEKLDCQIIQVHPLSTIQQIQAQLPKQPEKPMIVIIDDAHEASTLLLQKLSVPTDNIYWLLLAEPGISERVDAFAERRVDLPLFSKEDCYELLQKQLHDQPKYAQVSQMQSDTIWYSSEGLPKDILRHAKQNLGKLFTGQESSENFDKANKSWYMTAALGAAGLALIIVLIINWVNGDSVEGTVNRASKELVIAKKQSEEGFIADAESGQAELDFSAPNTEEGVLPITPQDVPISSQDAAVSSQGENADNQSSDGSSETVHGETVHGETVDNKSVDDKTVEPRVAEDKQYDGAISKEDVEEAAKSPDPIESIALTVAKKESKLPTKSSFKPSSKSASKPDALNFKQWLSSQSQDAYSLQLFSHTDKKSATKFKESLDLAESFVYLADLKGKKLYRVLWGSFGTRAEAEQAIDSLPSDILAQKPWIRQFSAISNEHL